MIDITRSSRLKVRISEIDFKALIAESQNNLRNIEGAHRMEVHPTIEAYLPYFSDARQLSVIFNNLISNAIRYQHAHEVNPRLDIHIEVDEKKAVMSFKDNGIGIAKEHLNKVFDMFFRVNGNSADGSGLGLYIVREIVKKMKGKVYAESAVGEGSRFVIELPNRIDPDLLRKLSKIVQNSK